MTRDNHNIRIVATRLHTSNERIMIDNDKLRHWCEHALAYCDLLVIVVDEAYDRSCGSMLESFGERIRIFFIHPWISYTQPLNMLVEKSLALGAGRIIFQSVEVEVEPEDIQKLYDHMDDQTLVVGAKLHNDHGAVPGEQTIDGWSTPWNTLAVWNLNKLGLTGFLTISSGNIDDIAGGVEEVPVISLLQMLRPGVMQAKLVELSSVVWNATWICQDRTDYHRQKMLSKNYRTQIQLEALGLQPGTVIVQASRKDES